MSVLPKTITIEPNTGVFPLSRVATIITEDFNTIERRQLLLAEGEAERLYTALGSFLASDRTEKMTA